MTDEIIAIRYLNKLKRCREKKREFTLTLGDYKRLMNTIKCYYTGVTLWKGKPREGYEPMFNALTLDRVDNSKGYTKENTVVCCHGWNQLKAQLESSNSGFEIKHLIKGANKTKKVMI